MKFAIFIPFILFSACSMMKKDPDLVPNTEKLVLEVVEDVVEEETGIDLNLKGVVNEK